MVTSHGILKAPVLAGLDASCQYCEAGKVETCLTQVVIGNFLPSLAGVMASKSMQGGQWRMSGFASRSMWEAPVNHSCLASRFSSPCPDNQTRSQRLFEGYVDLRDLHGPCLEACRLTAFMPSDCSSMHDDNQPAHGLQSNGQITF